MAVKIVRQPNKIALIGAPSSAAGFAPGSEKAPAALRAAGLIEKLQSIGYEVTDFGDCAARHFADDDEHKRARNIPEIVAALNDLKPRAELAAKSGGLILVLGGDCVQTVAVLAGARRYYKHISLIWFDRDADLNTPASTPSGRLDGMALAGIIGKGSPELVRFWGEPPLVREPDTLLYGIERLDPPEQEFLTRSPLRHVYAADIQAKGAIPAAQHALAQLHADARDFVLHLDLDSIAQEDFPATNVPGSGGLGYADAKASLAEFVKHKNLLGLDVAQYNPDKDPDGSSAKKLVELLVEVLSIRFAALNAPAVPAATAAPTSAEIILPINEEAETPAAPEPAAETPAAPEPAKDAPSEPAAETSGTETPEPSSSPES
ncbi:MAG TPA: arginase family protein [Candidatus Limnocylindrales bacterium]|nr:arginase family protein [Candidatus Limnocylindrales bacterium]